MTDVFQKLEKELPNYINQIKNRTNSEAKVLHEFTSFIQKVFNIEAKDLDFEVSVKSSVKQVRGRMDAVFGNIILEFKKDLKDIRALETAQDELEKYFQSLYEKDSKIKHVGIATDGLNFKVYQAIIKNERVSKIELINEISLDNNSTEKIFNWFDSYFFTSSKIIPTSEHLKQMFGLNSPSYAVIRQELLELFDKVKDSRNIKTKYSNWEKFLEIVYGDKPNEINLFIAHTYLSTFVKLIVYLKLTSKNQLRSYDILPILYGNVFSQLGIINFVEDDFFTWTMFISIRKQSSKIFEKILRDLEIYDLDQMNEDVLKELYQEMVRPDVRKQLGEFYTPDWLAEKMIIETLSDEPKKSVLDPSCGSGTFLFKTILYKIQKLRKSGMEDFEILTHILGNVIGFDIHPLAAHIAKTNYILGLREIINSRKGPITIPVYLSDSLKIPEKKQTITNTIPTFEFDTGILDKKFSFPENFADEITKMDDIIEKMKIHGHELEEKIGTITESSYKIDLDEVSKNLKRSFENSIANITDLNEKKIMMNNIQTLFELIHNNTDSIWPYILRNMYKPIALTHKKVDLIIGNPPWITLQHMKNESYQNFLKGLTKKYSLINKKNVHQISHMELASVFFSFVVDNYLNANGELAFVLPKSVLVSSHHENFREFLSPKFGLELVYDLEGVSPLFRIPSCVIFGKKNKKTNYPVRAEKISATLPNTNCQLNDVESSLSIKNGKYSPAKINSPPSYYFDKFIQGATIVPRNFYFVDIVDDSFLGVDLTTPPIKSSVENKTKPPWDKIKISGNIESKYIFGTIIGEDLVPFGIRKLRMVVLPINIQSKKISIISNSNELQRDGDLNAAKYFETIEKQWMNNATAKSKKMTPYRRLNYNNGITSQNSSKIYKVLYVASSTYLASCVIDTSDKKLFLDNYKIKLNGFVAESKTYLFETNSEDEAYYLSSILNSKVLDDKIKPFQTRGLWGARDIHRRPLLFPIPKFDPKTYDHLELAKLGKKCSEKVPEIVKKFKMSGIGKLRSLIRKELMEIEKINEIVNKIMK